VIADFLGQLTGLTEVGDTFVAAAEVGEVDAERGECSNLRLSSPDVAGERERPFADWDRVRMAPGDHQPACYRGQRVGVLGRARRGRGELSRAFQRSQPRLVVAGLV